MAFSKDAPKRATTTSSARKAGSKSPKHRGFRPDDAAAPAKKSRWSGDERAARGHSTDRPRGEGAPAPRAAKGERPNWEPREKPARGGFNDRGARTERPAYGDRTERPARSAYGDRAERPAYNRDDRAPRRDYDARPPRRDFDRDAAAPRSDSKFYPSRDAVRAGTSNDDIVLERLEAEAIQAVDVEGVSFGDLGIGGNIVRALAELGASAPFPIQAATIPDVLKGRNVLGRGRTGSGKTIAFGAPLVERLMENGGGKGRRPGRSPRALILAPTRELALQIDRTVQPIARSVGLFTTQIYGGVPQHRQVGALQRGVDIIVGTPGRIEDLVEQGRLDLSEVVITVLDEADHMCDLGFLEPVQRLLRETAPDGQRLMFSATLDTGVAALVDEFLENPAVHEVAGEDQASSTIEHRVLMLEQRDKTAVLEQLVSGPGKKLVFARTRAFAEQLSDMLEDAGIRSVSLHGDLNQSRRTRNLEQLTSGRVDVLVATDVAARGIHVDDITLVIQADAPDEYKTYLHRSGRTGRAGKTGMVVTLVPRSRRRKVEDLLSRAEIEAEWISVVPGDAIIDELAGA